MARRSGKVWFRSLLFRVAPVYLARAILHRIARALVVDFAAWRLGLPVPPYARMLGAISLEDVLEEVCEHFLWTGNRWAFRSALRNV
jgi:hypothetical protein